jgi:hypothetical protein
MLSLLVFFNHSLIGINVSLNLNLFCIPFVSLFLLKISLPFLTFVGFVEGSK